VIARWTGASYLIVAVLGLALAFALLLALSRGALHLPPILLLAWNVVFVFCLVMTILAHQIRFLATLGATRWRAAGFALTLDLWQPCWPQPGPAVGFHPARGSLTPRSPER
jgi:hypothetical protein